MGYVEVENYAGQFSIPYGLQLQYRCVCVQDGTVSEDVFTMDPYDETFTLVLSPPGEHDCTFTGKNEVWTAQSTVRILHIYS